MEARDATAYEGGHKQEVPESSIEGGMAPCSALSASLPSVKEYSSMAPSSSMVYHTSNSKKHLDLSIFKQRHGNNWSNGVTVGTDRLSYSVLPPKPICSSRKPTRRFLLKDVTFIVDTSEVAFIMGPSGSGKTTLLDALAGRLKYGFRSGQIFFNGRRRGVGFKENTAYVRQDDLHIPTLTVEELLLYASRLRIGLEYSESERAERVRVVTELLELDTCSHLLIGDATIRGISGGQLKRLSIAVEILHMPSLIFLDEPTSGLDSVMSFEVMAFASELSKQKRTVLATIHQPSFATFQLATKVVLLSAGRLVYCGPSHDLGAYFSSPRLGYSATHFGNPTEFALAVVSGTVTSKVQRHNADPDILAGEFQGSPYFMRPEGDPTWLAQEDSASRPSFVSQTATLLQRSWKAQTRDGMLTRVTIGKNVVIALVSGIIFFHQGNADPMDKMFSQASFNIASLWYFAVLFTIIEVMSIMPQLSRNRVLYQREYESGMCSAASYWAANAVIHIPRQFVAMLAFVEIAYWMIGFEPKFVPHIFVLVVTFLNHLVALQSAQLLAATFTTAAVALALYPLLFLFVASFTGFTIPVHLLPIGWRWVSYVVYPRWTYEALLINTFVHRGDDHAVLKYFGFLRYNQWYSVPILLGYMVVFNALVYNALRPRKSQLKFEDTETPQATKPQTTEDRGTESVHLALPSLGSQTSSYLRVEDFRAKSRDRLPLTQGLGLLFKDIEYSVGRTRATAKTVLKGVSGRVDPGEMCAIMGGSGAGKSTLLDVLALRKTTGFVTGEYFVGGKAYVPQHKWNSYVTQDNVHIAVFTVRETLEFAALLRLPEGLSRKVRRQRAHDVMTMLGLEDAADVVVGNALVKGISGGQLRRLSIGVEVIHLPDVIFLDEPTTGLDSAISHEVMAAVRSVAYHRRTVLCTIHSPSSQVYSLFDKLILLALGRQTYYGTTKDAVQYFSQPRIGWVMPRGQNPANFLLQASEGLLVADGGARLTIRELSNIFHDSESYSSVHEAITEVTCDVEGGGCSGEGEKDGSRGGFDAAAAVGDGATGLADAKLSDDYHAGNGASDRHERSKTPHHSHNHKARGIFALRHQSFPSIRSLSLSSHTPSSSRVAVFRLRVVLADVDGALKAALSCTKHPRSMLSLAAILAWRQMFKLTKMKRAVATHMLKSVVVGLFHGTLYFRLEPSAMQPRFSLMFFAMMYAAIANQAFLPDIFADRLLMYRERGAGVYSVFPYWISSYAPFILQSLASTTIYAVIVYYMTGLNTAPGHFEYFLLLLLQISLLGLFLSQSLAFLLPTSQTAVALYMPIIFLFVAFSGFVVRIPTLPAALRWAATVSFARWAFQGLLINEYHHNYKLEFSPIGHPKVHVQYSDNVYEVVLETLGFQGYSKWDSVPVLAIWGVALWALCYLPARMVNYERR